ncbi:GNAT family N-acetyltransferase [Streptomyces sp. NPDC048172]|uniref:GNAT family N-acetyltransferase n=1 Tax=Streptomyces sp. NPDC048172 TaxID=3365505 RepID=UPI003720DFCC
MHQVTLTRATAQDAPALTAMVRTSRAYGGVYAPMVEGYEVTPAYIARHEVFKATDTTTDTTTDTLLGFYALLLEPPPELDLAFVADEAQGRGIGRALLAHMRERARAAGLTDVRVVSHPPAEPFYLRMGAERVGTVPAAPPKITWPRPDLRLPVTSVSR